MKGTKPKMIGLKEVLVVALICSSTTLACFGGSDAPEGAASDFCQICVDMVTKANGMDVMDSEEYLRHVSMKTSQPPSTLKESILFGH